MKDGLGNFNFNKQEEFQEFERYYSFDIQQGQKKRSKLKIRF